MLQPSGALFNPRTLGSLVGWIEPDKGSRVNAALTTISAKNHLTTRYALLIGSHTFTDNQVNGYDVVISNASSAALSIDDGMDFSNTGSAWTMFFLARLSSSGTVLSTLYFNSKDEETQGGLEVYYDGVNILVKFYAPPSSYPGAGTVSASFAYTAGSYDLFTIKYNAATSTLTLDVGTTNKINSSSFSPQTDSNNLFFGAVFDDEDSTYSGGASGLRLASLMWFNSVLGSTDTDNVRLYYYNRKYNLGL